MLSGLLKEKIYYKDQIVLTSDKREKSDENWVYFVKEGQFEI